MKSIDEIKKGLECCARGDCHSCPYVHNCNLSTSDALALIRQLQDEKVEQAERIHQLEAERDAAVTFLPRRCHLCKHVGNKMGDAPCPSFCEYITLEECPNWQWRGVQKEDDDA